MRVRCQPGTVFDSNGGGLPAGYLAQFSLHVYMKSKMYLQGRCLGFPPLKKRFYTRIPHGDDYSCQGCAKYVHFLWCTRRGRARLLCPLGCRYLQCDAVHVAPPPPAESLPRTSTAEPRSETFEAFNIFEHLHSNRHTHTLRIHNNAARSMPLPPSLVTV